MIIEALIVVFITGFIIGYAINSHFKQAPLKENITTKPLDKIKVFKKKAFKTKREYINNV